MTPLIASTASFTKSQTAVPPAPWIVHDRVNQFVIENGRLLWRLFETGEWSQTQLPEGLKATQVKADWENLMVLDVNGDVHYAKSAQGTESQMKDLDWHTGIWDLPVISEIYNRIVRDPNIAVAKGECWSCSYLEAGAYYVDGAGQRHLLGDAGIGPTTTAFVADQVNRCFRYYDPFIPKWSEDAEDLYIPFPETATCTFELKGMASSRSGLFILGYDVKAAPKGGVEKSLALYFLSADANLRGLNPGITYTYESNPNDPSKFALPASLYQKLPFPDGGVCATLGVERGEGPLMTDVVLTISGVKDGARGYFYLPLGEEEWKFQEKKGEEQEVLPVWVKDDEQTFETSLQNCDGFTWDGEYAVLLKGFGRNALQCQMTVRVNGEMLPFYLYPKCSQWNLVGFDKLAYTLVIPKKTRKTLGWDCGEAVPVKVETTKERLKIVRESNGNEIFHFRYRGEEPDRRCVIF